MGPRDGAKTAASGEVKSLSRSEIAKRPPPSKGPQAPLPSKMPLLL